MIAGSRAPAPDVGECRACGKIRYTTRDDARHAARVIGAKYGTRMRAYECESYWHISSMTADAIAALRSGDQDDGCPLCGKPAYRCADEAREHAKYLTGTEGGFWYAADCGESWHVRRFRWSGGYHKGARRKHRETLRLDAEWRDQKTEPKRRSTKRRAKRPKSTAAKEST